MMVWGVPNSTKEDKPIALTPNLNNRKFSLLQCDFILPWNDNEMYNRFMEESTHWDVNVKSFKFSPVSVYIFPLGKAWLHLNFSQ